MGKVLIGLLIGFALIAFVKFEFWASEFLEIDHCLDKGGRWNYQLKKCETIENCFEKGGIFNYETGECEYSNASHSK